MLGLVDEVCDPLPTIAHAPDHVRVVAGSERLTGPVSVEALHDLINLMLMRSDDRVVASLCQILRLPVQRHDPRGLVVDDHRLLMSEVEGGRAVEDFDSCGG